MNGGEFNWELQLRRWPGRVQEGSRTGETPNWWGGALQLLVFSDLVALPLHGQGKAKEGGKKEAAPKKDAPKKEEAAPKKEATKKDAPPKKDAKQDKKKALL